MAIRFNVEFSAGWAARVAETRFVDMQALPSDPLEGYERRSGLWVELRDLSGKALYRRVMQDPRGHLEGPSEDGRRIISVRGDRAPGVFSVVVPEDDRAVRFAIIGTASGSGLPEPVVIAGMPQRL